MNRRLFSSVVLPLMLAAPAWAQGNFPEKPVRLVVPYGVDVAGGVEAEGEPRHKDPAKIVAFVENARRAARR